MSLNLASIIENSFKIFPDAVATIHDDFRLDYRQLRQRVVAFAAYLKAQGICPGDRVGLLLPNSISFTIAYFGVLHRGAIVVPVSPLSVAGEVASVLGDCKASLLVAWADHEQAGRGGVENVGSGCKILLLDESEGPLTIQGGPAVDPEGFIEPALTTSEDTAVILYTSGTTGDPKGAELTHFNMYSNAQFSCERLLWTPRQAESVGPGHVGLAALPLFHSFGQTCIQNACLFGGAAVTYLDRFEPEKALEVMARDRVTLFCGVPTMYFQLLRSGGADQHDLSALRFCVSGGASMPVEVMREFDQLFGVNILEGYGLSETSPVATFNVLWQPRKHGSIGIPIPGVDVRIVGNKDRELPAGEVGELVIRGHNVMKGYYGRPDDNREAFRNGWFHTGDLGKKDDDGYIFIVGRKKDIIIRGGFNVYPREVEEVLYSHRAVAEAAVVGVPDPEYGEEVKAFIALGPNAETTPEEIIQYGKERLGAHKYPRLVEILPSLPKGPTGKILKKELRN